VDAPHNQSAYYQRDDYRRQYAEEQEETLTYDSLWRARLCLHLFRVTETAMLITAGSCIMYFGDARILCPMDRLAVGAVSISCWAYVVVLQAPSNLATIYTHITPCDER
jgi:hypothetical protein